MISFFLKIEGSDQAAAAAAALRRPQEMHQTMAGATEGFLKEFGRQTTPEKHATAWRLGGRETGHLSDAYEAVESTYDAGAVHIWLPRTTRLRAAFGEYTARPGPDKNFLTIPLSAEAYGQRAPEMEGLVFVRPKGAKNPLLVRPLDGGALEAHFLLVTGATIPEAPDLIPFEDLADEAVDAALDHIMATPT